MRQLPAPRKAAAEGPGFSARLRRMRSSQVQNWNQEALSTWLREVRVQLGFARA